MKGIVFSSSCTVYGEPDKNPIDENAPIKPAASPYGNTKQINEEIIQDFDVFKEKVRAIFGMTNEKNAATRIIQSIRQKTSAVEYAARFKENAILTGWD